MCNTACIEFGALALRVEEVRGKEVIEVGARDINGSLRNTVEQMGPLSYLGVDIEPGPGVDAICNIYELAARYGQNCFDLVISTELLEHVRHWRTAITNLKRIVKPNGHILLTTRSEGFGYHGYPFDYWRYSIDDMRTLFRDCDIEAIQSDPLAPGVFVKVKKPPSFLEANLDDYQLYSVVSDARRRTITELDLIHFKTKRGVRQLATRLLPRPVKALLKTIIR